MLMGHFSSASGMTVWLVKLTVSWTISKASSKSTPFSSTRMRSSSGPHMAGWVSLVWTLTRFPRFAQSGPKSFS